MRSNNFFDQFNDELDGVILLAQTTFIAGSALILLAVGGACFWLLR